jgi:hypothetical protein
MVKKMNELLKDTLGYYKALKERLSTNPDNENQVKALQDIIDALEQSEDINGFRKALDGGLQLELDRALVVDINLALSETAEKFEETPTADMYRAVAEKAKGSETREELDRDVETTMEEKNEIVRKDSLAKTLFIDLIHATQNYEVSPEGEIRDRALKRFYDYFNQLEGLGYDFVEMTDIRRFRELHPYNNQQMEKIKGIYLKITGGGG